jgi:hypothetical protein
VKRILLLFLIACGEPQLLPDTGFPMDAAEDAGVDTGTPDAGSMDALPDDRGMRDAAAIDGSLVGTSLEGITIEWPAELLLCEAWLSGEDVAAAAAQKVQVRLPPHSRASLEPADLGGATLSQGDIHRSPFSADQWRIAGSSSTLIEWTLTPPNDMAHLSATIAHDLGAAGTLYEIFSVRRSGGDRSQVRYDSGEVAFAYEPPGVERFLLRPCDIEENLENGVVVLAAFNGTESVTLVREQKMQLVVAGSGAVYPTRAEALISSQPAWTEGFLAAGHFTQAYTAGHHNWNEHALVRFDHDLKWSYLVFGPLARGEMPSYPAVMPQTIQLSGLNTPGSVGSLSLTSVDLPSGAVSNQTFSVDVDWRRVDETHLLRTLFGCPAPEIISVWGLSQNGTHLFQLGFCQAGAPLTDLELFVPIYFEPDPHHVGTPFDKSSIAVVDVEGTPGVEIDLGTHYVQLVDQGGYRLLILDAARAELEDTYVYSTELFETSPFAGQPERIAAESEDSAVSATLVRQWVAQGAGNSGIYAPVSFELRFGSETHRSIAWDKLVYTNSHHNWDDTLETDDGVLRMFWRVLEFGQAYEVRAERLSDGSEALPPTVLR